MMSMSLLKELKEGDEKALQMRSTGGSSLYRRLFGFVRENSDVILASF